MTIKNAKKILIAPLDWGLGHTTRCVPIIHHLYKMGHQVLFAGNQSQRTYIAQTFPEIPTIPLNGYDVRYTKDKTGFILNIARQVPRLLKLISAEHQWLKNIVEEHSIDAIISDNRYGLYHDTIPCAIMTHQLQVLSGLGSFVDKAVYKLHLRFLNRFNYCWVVDSPEPPGIAGMLSHPDTLPDNIKYIGPLSQIESTTSTNNGYLLVLLSGPEPQRTVLSDIIWQQLQSYAKPVVFVEGSNDVTSRQGIPNHIEYYKRVASKQLAGIISGASIVVCRSGYSTIMDLIKLNKAAILIPTPGQTEQEYLGRTLHNQGRFYCVEQSKFNLADALSDANKFSNYQYNADNFNLHCTVINDWLSEN